GIRTLSPLEKMYNLRASGNPSSWQGPIWINVNYLVFRGLVKYGYNEQARELAEKTILLLGRDYERFGALHEYYLPDNGEPVLNKGFQNWNLLVLNMAAWLEGKKYVTEF
ncbi:MAG: glycoside hydrolase family 37, partial [Prevotella sp.]|nr:glycoside hydrolase family 37 [Prevotella sp.]